MAVPSCRFPSKLDPFPPIPPEELTTQVLGHAASVENFLYGGFVVSEGIKEILALLGRPLESFSKVLDFGCGSARILRWFEPYSSLCSFVGSDISGSAMEWNRRHIPFGEYITNGMTPPIAVPDCSFDLIYGISIVTHISEELQLAWLAELQRIIRPGGFVLLSVMGTELAAWRLSASELEEYQNKGHVYKKVQEGGLHGLPEFYQDAYHSRSYVLNTWSKYFVPVAYIRNGPLYYQDLVVLIKPEKPSRTDRGFLDLALPFGVINEPRISDTVGTSHLTIMGWTLQHGMKDVTIDLVIDEKLWARCIAAQPTPVVAKALPTFSAENCGFSAVLPMDGLKSGPHVLKAYLTGQSVSHISTYFFVTQV